MTKLTYGSLFSGIGCFDLAAERAGWECRWQCELDRDARRVLARHWPQVERHEDITQIDPTTLPPVDLIIGGFPCQSLSVAGKRAGFKDRQKSGLFHEMVRIVDGVRPAFVLWENVPGLLSGGDDEDEADLDGIGGVGGTAVRSVPWMATVLGGFRRIGYRHGVWRMLDGLHWVPQRRRRVFGLFARGVAGDGVRLASEESGEDFGGLVELLAEVLLEQDSSGRNPAKGKRPRANDSAATGSSTAGDSRGIVYARSAVNCLDSHMQYGLDDNAAQAGHIVAQLGQRIPDVLKHVGGGHFRAGEPSLAASDDNRSNQVVVSILGDHTHTLRARGSDAGEDGTGRGTPLVAYSFQERGREGGRCLDWIENEAYTLLTPAGGSRSQERNVAYGFTIHGTPASSIASQTDACSSLTAKVPGSIQNSTTTVVADGLICRRLTPTECLRLQGLPDNWLDLDDGGKPLSDSAKYRMIGNGGVVPCVQWILDRLRRCVTGCNTEQNSPDLD